MKKGVLIGLKNVVVAKLLDDPITGTATYDTPRPLVGAITANVNPNASNATLFADDGPYDNAATIGEISVELNLADLALPDQAFLLGHDYTGGVLRRRASDIPPFVALGFKTLKSNGSYRYTWLSKGKFLPSEQGNQTKGDSINFNTPSITGSFLKSDCDEEWERHIDEDDTDFVPSMATTWFENPYGGTPDTVAPTISGVVPVDAATAVARNSSIVWTFDKELQLTSVNTANFIVFNKTTGDQIAGTLTIDSARKVVSFKPSANLAATTEYGTLVTTGVRSAGGIPLASAKVSAFTTAA